MLNKIQSDSPGWEGTSKTHSRSSARPDAFHKIERDKERPPTKQEAEQTVEKKPRSIMDLGKKTSTSLSKSSSPAKGKTSVGKGETERRETRSTKEAPRKEGDREDEEELGDKDEGKEIESSEPEASSPETKPQKPLTPPTKKFASEEHPIPEQEPETPQEAPKAEPAKPQQPTVKQPHEQLAMKKPVSMKKPAQLHPAEGPKTTFAKGKVESFDKKESSKPTRASAKAEEGEKGVAASAQAPNQPVSLQTEKAPESGETTRPSKTVAMLAEKIVDTIQVMQKEGQTNTIITLKNPPVLAGATVTITTKDPSEGFKISFANLSDQAKLFLDQKLREDSLAKRLDDKGIICLGITTGTEPEKIFTAEAGQPTKDQREQQQEQQQQQKQKQQKFGEEEET